MEESTERSAAEIDGVGSGSILYLPSKAQVTARYESRTGGTGDGLTTFRTMRQGWPRYMANQNNGHPVVVLSRSELDRNRVFIHTMTSFGGLTLEQQISTYKVKPHFEKHFVPVVPSPTHHDDPDYRVLRLVEGVELNKSSYVHVGAIYLMNLEDLRPYGRPVEALTKTYRLDHPSLLSLMALGKKLHRFDSATGPSLSRDTAAAVPSTLRPSHSGSALSHPSVPLTSLAPRYIPAAWDERQSTDADVTAYGSTTSPGYIHITEKDFSCNPEVTRRLRVCEERVCGIKKTTWKHFFLMSLMIVLGCLGRHLWRLAQAIYGAVARWF